MTKKMSLKKKNSSRMPDPEVQDRMDYRVPHALYWSANQVANWMEQIGFPQYRNCITANFIAGRHLIKLDASSLAKIGIRDFDHIKFISRSITELLKIENVTSEVHISRPPRSDLGMYLETKSFKGLYCDQLTYETFLRSRKDEKWKPPLTNYGFLTLPTPRESLYQEKQRRKPHLFFKQL